MAARTWTRAHARRAVLTLVSAVAVCGLVQPGAHADESTAAAGARGEMSAPRPTQDVRLRRNAVELEQRLLEAEVTSREAARRLARLTGRTTRLA